MTPAPLVTVLLLPWVWLAFLVPGFVALRTWLRTERALVLALPATLAALYACALALQLLGLPIRGATVGAGLIGLSILGHALGARFGTNRRPEPLKALVARGVGALVEAPLPIAVVAGLVVVLSISFWREPLVLSDNLFRWRNLAQQIYALRTLDFYPPRSAADFQSYFMADGMSPLVALGYWWCFALTGASAPWRALGFIQLEAVWVVIAVAALASRLRAGSGRAAVVLASTTSIAWIAAALGSEAPLLTVGTTLAILALLEPDEPESLVTLVLGTAIAGLAREYGLGTAFLVAATLVWQRRPWRFGLAWLVAFTALAGSWYLRNLVRSGNPLFMIEIPGLFRGNPVFNFYLRYAKTHQHLSLHNVHGIITTVYATFTEGMAVWTLGGALLAAAIVRRLPRWNDRRAPLLLGVFSLVWIATFVSASNQSASGPLGTIRVLAPVTSLLAAVAAAFGGSLLQRKSAKLAAGFLVLKTAVDVMLGYGAVYAFDPRRWAFDTTTQPKPLPEELAAPLRQAGGGILTDDGTLEIGMRASGLHAVPPWDPAFAFLFDDAVASDQMVAVLRARQVAAYIPFDWSKYAPATRAALIEGAFATWKPLGLAKPSLLVPATR